MTAAFLLGTVLAFFASFFPGLINMSIVNAAVQRGMSAAFKMTLGASIIAAFQGFIGLYFGRLLNNNETWQVGIQWAAIIIFISMGLYQVFYADKRMTKRQEQAKKKPEIKTSSMIFKGMALAALNVLAILYWMFFGLWTISKGWLENTMLNLLLFCCGIILGAILIFSLYARLGQLIVARMEFIQAYMNRAIGFLLLGLGVWQLIAVLATYT